MKKLNASRLGGGVGSSKHIMLNKVILLSLIFATLRITVELTWNAEQVSYSCCQGKNQLLMWNYTKEINERIMELQWFFNETTLICLESKIIGFHVEAFYTGRVERNGKAGILMKNISFNDTGKYSLYVKLAEEKMRHIQHILLTVDEGVPHQCKPTIERHNNTVLYCSTTCSKTSHLSTVWRIKDTLDQVGNGPYLRLDAGKTDHAVCCLTGMECHEEKKNMSCLPISFPSNISREYAPNNRQKEPNRKDADHQTTEVQIILYIWLPAILLFAILFAFLGFAVHFSLRKQMTVEIKSKTSNIVEKRDENFKDVKMLSGTKDLVKHTEAHTQTECTYIFQDGNISTASTDHTPNRPNSNQNIQIVNNIRLDGDLIKLLMTQPAREENRKLKLQTPSYKCEEKLNTSIIDKFIEMTVLPVHSPHRNHSF